MKEENRKNLEHELTIFGNKDQHLQDIRIIESLEVLVHATISNFTPEQFFLSLFECQTRKTIYLYKVTSIKSIPPLTYIIKLVYPIKIEVITLYFNQFQYFSNSIKQEYEAVSNIKIN